MNIFLFPYFSDVTDPHPRVSGRCLHLLSDILLIGLCTCLTGSSDFQYMCLFGLERGNDLGDLLSLPNNIPVQILLSVFLRALPRGTGE